MEPIKKLSEIAAIGGNTSTAVVEAQDEYTIEAVVRAKKDSLINPLLIGNGQQISDILKSMDEDPAAYRIIATEGIGDSLKKAITLTHSGEASVLMKGKLQTADFLRAVVSKDSQLNTGRRLSMIGLYELPAYHKLLCVTDCVLNTYPDLNEKKDILQNAVTVMRHLGIGCPKAAVIAAVETVNPKMPETLDAHSLKEMNKRGEITDCVVEGPISFDLAVTRDAAIVKDYVSPVAGDADILLMPDIVSGNTLVKAFTIFAGGITAGNIIGAKIPIVITSRSSAASDKYYSIALAALLGQA